MGAKENININQQDCLLLPYTYTILSIRKVADSATVRSSSSTSTDYYTIYSLTLVACSTRPKYRNNKTENKEKKKPLALCLLAKLHRQKKKKKKKRGTRVELIRFFQTNAPMDIDTLDTLS